MRKIRLTNNKYVLVDNEDYDYLNSLKWYAIRSGKNYYARRNVSKKENGITTRGYIHMQYLIVDCPKGLLIDHKDRNTLNNQKSNLRICTKSQNNVNRAAYGKSKYMGVHYRDNKYKDHINRSIVASIQVNRVLKYIGAFKTDEDAAMAYDKEALKLHGEFASLNFPDLIR